MPYFIDFGHWNSLFAVPASIVDEHIKMCGGASLKAILILLRNAGGKVTAEDIASMLGLTPADIRDALNYWVEAGIIKADDTPEAVNQNVPAPPPTRAPSLPEHKIFITTKNDIESNQLITRVSSRPKLTPTEILELAADDRQVQYLIDEAQRIFSDVLTGPETETLVSLYSYNKIPADIMLMTLSYCKSINRGSIPYFSRTICGWIDQGIDTHEKVERHIKELTAKRSNEGAVMSAFGISDRSLTKKEKNYIDKWFCTHNQDISMILLAYEKTIDSTGKMSFPYIDKILTDWHKKGYTSVKQAESDQKNTGTKKQAEASPSYDLDRLKNSIIYGPIKD